MNYGVNDRGSAAGGGHEIVQFPAQFFQLVVHVNYSLYTMQGVFFPQTFTGLVKEIIEINGFIVNHGVL